MSNTVTLKIKNKKKFQHFLALVKGLDFVEVLKKDRNKKKKKASEDDFFALAGMWGTRDISAEDLRTKAWPKEK